MKPLSLISALGARFNFPCPGRYQRARVLGLKFQGL